jgi:hypothetical protein
MTHMIQGLIVPPGPAAKVAAFGGAVACPLDASDLVFVPMTDRLLDCLKAQFPAPIDKP